MSKILVIPDIHLKPWIFDRAEKILRSQPDLKALCLMDIPDDFDQQYNMNLYEETIRRAVKFAKDFPDTLWCYGNHDLSYIWNKKESGYSYTFSYLIEKEMRNLIEIVGDKAKIIHRINDVLFMHGGLTREYLEEFIPKYESMSIDQIIDIINDFGPDELWYDTSPLWARPQYYNLSLYPEGYFQVVGHTPVKTISFDEDKLLLSCDVFSTNSNRSKYGEEKFVIVDTKELSWKYA